MSKVTRTASFLCSPFSMSDRKRSGRKLQPSVGSAFLGSSFRNACLLLAALLGLLTAGQNASASVLTWSNSGTSWSATADWWGGSAPGSADTALFNYGPTYSNQPSLGSSAAVGGLWDTGNGSLTIGGGAYTLTINGGTINGNSGTGLEMDPSAGALTISASVALGGAQQWLNNSGNILTASGGVANGGFMLTYAGSSNAVIGGANNTTQGLTGSGGLIMNGTGLLMLAGSGITYTGATTVSSGTLEFYNTRNYSNLSTTANTMSIASGAMLQFYVDNTYAAGDGANQILGSQVNGSGTTITGGGTLQKIGNGELATNGNGNNSFLTVSMSAGGLIDIEGGILKNGGWGRANWTANKASMLIGANGELDVWDGPAVYIDALNGSGIVDKNQNNGSDLLIIGVNNGSGTFSGIIRNTNTTGVLAITKTGSGLEILSGANSYGGATTISGGTLQIGAGGNTGSLGTGNVPDNAVLVFSRSDNGLSVAGAISGTGVVINNGSGIVTLSSTGSNWSGGTTINAGGLVFGSSSCIGSGAQAVTIAAGGVMGAGYPINQAFLGVVAPASTGNAFTVALGASSANNLNFSTANLPLASLGAVGSQTYSGVLTPSGTTYQLGGGAGTLTLANGLNGPDSLVVTGSGTQSTVVLNAAGTFSGGITINSGVLVGNAAGR